DDVTKETLTVLGMNDDGVNLDYVDEDGVITQIDLAAVITTNETTTALVNNDDGTLSYTDEDGNTIVINTTVVSGNTFIDDNTIHLVEFSSTTQVMQAFRNEVIDAAALTLDEALMLAQNGEQLTIVLALDISNGGDAIIGQADIKSLADLHGKLIGVEGSTVGLYLLHRALTTTQFEDSDFSTTFIDANNHIQALINHQVDAVVTFEPMRSKLLNQGAKLLFDSSQIPNEIVDVLVVRSDFLENYSNTVQQLLYAWYDALAYLNNHPKEAAKIMSARLNLNTVEVLNAFKGIILPDEARNRQLLQTKPKPELYEMAQKMVKFMDQHQLSNKTRSAKPNRKNNTDLALKKSTNIASLTLIAPSLFAPTLLHYKTSPKE
ncbi:MAG: hypothetical protein COB35_13910, partial [Gammaproteobacteria bacterium]